MVVLYLSSSSTAQNALSDQKSYANHNSKANQQSNAKCNIQAYWNGMAIVTIMWMMMAIQLLKLSITTKLNSMSFIVLILDKVYLCPFVSMILDLVSFSVNDTGFSVF